MDISEGNVAGIFVHAGEAVSRHCDVQRVDQPHALISEIDDREKIVIGAGYKENIALVDTVFVLGSYRDIARHGNAALQLRPAVVHAAVIETCARVGQRKPAYRIAYLVALVFAGSVLRRSLKGELVRVEYIGVVAAVKAYPRWLGKVGETFPDSGNQLITRARVLGIYIGKLLLGYLYTIKTRRGHSVGSSLGALLRRGAVIGIGRLRCLNDA